MDMKWNLKSHLTCTLVELTLGHARWTWGEIWKVISHAPRVRTLVVEGTLGHARWMWAEIWKVISRAPHARTLLLDVTSLISPGQMRKICRNFSLYTFLMSSRVDMRWHLKSHLTSTSCENFGVLGHTRWTWGEIWKVISHAPRMRTFPLYTFHTYIPYIHLVTLDGHEVKFEKSSHMHLGGADTWSC